jgi:hypothetical protein
MSHPSPLWTFPFPLGPHQRFHISQDFHSGVLLLRQFYFKSYDNVKNYTHSILGNIIKPDGEEYKEVIIVPCS